MLQRPWALFILFIVSIALANATGTEEYTYNETIFTEKTVESAKKPWHFYYYPIMRRELFDTTDSPLQKLLRVSSNPEAVQRIIDSETNRANNPAQLQPWFGRCHALSLAATMHPIRNCDVSYNGEVFTRLDQRALLAFNYENILTPNDRFFVGRGRPNKADELAAANLHEFLYRHFFNAPNHSRMSFILDIDQSHVVTWQPAYKVHIKPHITRVSRRRGITVLYEVTIFMAKHLFVFDPSELNTNEILTEKRTYQYYIQYHQVGPNQYQVVDEQWESDEHPGIIYSALRPNTPVGPFNNNVPVETINNIMNAPCTR